MLSVYRVKMVEFAAEVGFKLLTSTPYYAQANGQVEVANKIVIDLIKNTWVRRQRIDIEP